MKKVFIFLTTIIFLMSGLSACACFKKKSQTINNLDVLPTMESKSEKQNQVWVGTFQIVWNDLINELLKQPVEFVGVQSNIAEELNKQNFTIEDISENSYYKKWGLVSPELKREIKKGIKEKFNESSDILDKFDWKPADGKYLLYAMLKKDFEYAKPLDKIGSRNFNGSNGEVEYFGILKSSKSGAREIVNVLFYNNKNDFGISLKTKNKDIIYFYRTDDKKTLTEYYSDMTDKTKLSKSNRTFTKNDELIIPNLDFKVEKSFDELCFKPIKNSNFIISQAIEAIDFKMDNKGVKLKSEAGIGIMKMSLEPIETRYFYLDNQYIIFMQEKEKPYFALKVSDAKALQK